MPKPAVEGPDLLVDAHVGRHRGAPQLWGAERASLRLAGLPLPCACLKTRFAGGYETRGLRRLCPGFATGGRSPAGKWGLARRRRSHNRHRFEGTLPAGSARALKAFWPAEPLARELRRWLPQDRLPAGEVAQRSPAGPTPPGTEGLRSRRRGRDCSHRGQVTVEMANVEGQRRE